MFEVARCIATYCYIGLLPKMPGTWGSIFAIPLAWVLYKLGNVPYWVAFISVTLIGVWSSKVYSERVGKEDPDEVVIDEVAGILTVFLFVKPTPLMLVLGLVLFRFIDILKPPPIGWFEKIPHGVGIMVDDLLAGVLTGVILLSFERFYGFG